MENYPGRVNGAGQFYPDRISDRKSRFWQIDNQPISKSEVICPQPCRPTRVSCLTNTLSRASSKSKGVKPMYRMDCAAEILDLLNQDEWDNDGFFCGSPPVRANNPVIHDPQFVVASQSLASSIGNSPSVMQAGRLERGSPTCGSSVGGSPKVRIEGFACSNPGKHHVAPALA
ncbi:uncharacterized protein LOC121998018 [Zingiber officinale]|uniref:uncharacterized protein LOC121998018 n=1 Tax=Zingiber officinale TaxID=94328 RepID=UPI001C4BD887|nr:uncharacterized protein LOC121998018 [Zingiber officinale]